MNRARKKEQDFFTMAMNHADKSSRKINENSRVCFVNVSRESKPNQQRAPLK